MHLVVVAMMLTLLAPPVFAAEQARTEEQKTLYTIGFLLSRSLAVFQLTPGEFESVRQGFADAGVGKAPDVEIGAYTEKVQQLALARRKVQAEKQAASDKGFRDGKAREKGAVKTDSGLVYLMRKEGSGAAPGPSDTVKVNYRGMLPDGKEFDSSYGRGEPVEIRMDGVIECWSEALQKMKAGGKAELVCPPGIAYGDAGAGELIPPGATLAFEVELLEVKK